jgi:hypothetical protein
MSGVCSVVSLRAAVEGMRCGDVGRGLGLDNTHKTSERQLDIAVSRVSTKATAVNLMSITWKFSLIRRKKGLILKRGGDEGEWGFSRQRAH